MQYAAFARDGNECLWISFAGQHRLAIIGQDTQTSLPMMADRWYCIPRCMQVNNFGVRDLRTIRRHSGKYIMQLGGRVMGTICCICWGCK